MNAFHAHDHVCEGRLMSAPHVAVIGLGLMGASFAAALKATDAVSAVTGYDVDDGAAAYCRRHGYIDTAATTAAEAAAQADIVVLAVPVSALADTARQIAAALKEGAVVTDLSSVKQEAVHAVSPHLPDHAIFVPGHPIAGRSVNGAEAALADLFQEKLVILTPEKDTVPHHAVAAVARLWETVGSRVERMSAANHDIIYAYVSHLPQLMAYAACQTLGDVHIAENAPPSFRQFIRLGGSHPGLWSEIVTANAEFIRHALGHTLATLDHMEEEFAQGNAQGAVSEDSLNTAIRYFPLLAAGTLISVITQFEEQNGVRLGAYAGTGFRDFISPAAEDPDKELEGISASYQQVARFLQRFRDTLESLYAAIGDPTVEGQKNLRQLLETCQSQHVNIMARIATMA